MLTILRYAVAATQVNKSPKLCKQGCNSLLSIGGDNLQFYPNFALFSTLGGMNLDNDFFLVSKSSEDQKQKRSSSKMELCPNSGEDQKKKRSSPKMEHFFSPNSSGDLRSDAHRSQIFGGDADEDHTQIIGRDTVKLLGGIHPPRVSAPLFVNKKKFYSNQQHIVGDQYCNTKRHVH